MLIAALPEDQREVLRLRYAEGLLRDEIAEVLDIPLSVVKSRIYEALKALRGKLNRPDADSRGPEGEDRPPQGQDDEGDQ
jgi:RNA polymerase sigma-70 factor (ECF subfamily)